MSKVLHSAILSTFIKLPFAIKTVVLSIFDRFYPITAIKLNTPNKMFFFSCFHLVTVKHLYFWREFFILALLAVSTKIAKIYSFEFSYTISNKWTHIIEIVGICIQRVIVCFSVKNHFVKGTTIKGKNILSFMSSPYGIR